MTLFAYVDENGNWRITHLQPPEGENWLRICCTDEPMFFDAHQQLVEVTIAA